MSVAKFDRFEDLEDLVVDYLASVTDLKVFGRTIDFLQVATQTYLENPIWEKLQQSMEYCIVFRDCSEVLHSQECLEGCPLHDIPLAVHVPMNPQEMVPEGAFAGLPRLRHVSIEPGIRFVGAFFSHEYGRRVGMVPRSSLKEGKNSQMVEKGTKTTQQQKTQTTANHSPQAESPPSCSLSSVLR